MQQAFSLIVASKAIEISNKGSLRVAMDGDSNSYDEVIELLTDQAPDEANAIVGIQISTSIWQRSTGDFLYVTIAGTPIVYEES